MFLDASDYANRPLDIFLKNKLLVVPSYIKIRGLDYFDRLDDDGNPPPPAGRIAIPPPHSRKRLHHILQKFRLSIIS